MANVVSKKELDVTVTVDRPLSDGELKAMHAYWRACNYLSVGMIYLKDNPLLKEPLTTDHSTWFEVPEYSLLTAERTSEGLEFDIRDLNV